MVTQKENLPTCTKGFTLVELLLAMTVSGIILMAVFLIFRHQQRHYATQLDVTEMQQNIRGAINVLSRDIRMAGFDSPSDPIAEIKYAEPDLFYFTYDLNEDGDVQDAGEHIAYDMFTTAEGIPVVGRTVNVAGSDITVTAGAITAPVHQPVADYIEHLEFLYLDKDGDKTTDEKEVHSVVLSLIARAAEPDPKFQNTTTYNAASNTSFYNSASLPGTSWVKNDNFRRRFQMLRIDCRNMGL